MTRERLFENARQILMIGTVWTLLMLVLLLSELGRLPPGMPPGIGVMILSRLAYSWLFGLLALLFIVPVNRLVPITGSRWWLGAAAHVVAALLFVQLATWFITSPLAAPAWNNESAPRLAPRAKPAGTFFFDQTYERFFHYLLLVGLAHVSHSFTLIRRSNREKAVLEKELAEARLATLKSQLQPHFLFNALNTVSALMDTDVRKARDTLESIGHLLRSALDYGAHPYVTVGEELDFVRRYLQIEKTRLGGRLTVEWAIAPDVIHAQVPAMAIQPIVENALKHGVTGRVEGGTVRIGIQRQGQSLHIEVSDDGPGFDVSSINEQTSGVGLRNLRSRLRGLYGAKATLNVDSSNDGGTCVSMVMPLQLMVGELVESDE